MLNSDDFNVKLMIIICPSPILATNDVAAALHFIFNSQDFGKILTDVHTKIVGETVDLLQPNRVMNGPPPLINPNETYLPRLTRSTLSQ